MAERRVRVTGADSVARALRRLRKDVTDWSPVTRVIAFQAASRGRAEVPVRSGTLRSTVRGEATKDTARVVVGIYRKVPYAGPVGYGWKARNIKGDGFPRRIVSKARASALERISHYVELAKARTGRTGP